MKSKKGDMFQIIFALILILIVSVVGLILLIMSSEVNNFWQESGFLNQSETAQNAISTIQTVGPRATDYAVFFLFIGLIIGSFIAAVRTQFNAVTVFLFLLFMLFAIIVAAGYVNLYRGLADNPVASNVSADLHFTNLLFSKYTPLIIAVICAFIMIIMFGKSGGEVIR